jgi:hypothetical protein
MSLITKYKLFTESVGSQLDADGLNKLKLILSNVENQKNTELYDLDVEIKNPFDLGFHYKKREVLQDNCIRIYYATEKDMEDVTDEVTLEFGYAYTITRNDDRDNLDVMDVILTKAEYKDVVEGKTYDIQKQTDMDKWLEGIVKAQIIKNAI